VQDIMLFNDAISNQRLEELKLNGNKFTWTNKQSSPLLERLDWMFASASWLANYPSSSVSTLSLEIYQTILLASYKYQLTSQKLGYSDLKIIGCCMMTLCRSCSMGGASLWGLMTKRRGSWVNSKT
jgi:hypothetical protein